METADPTGVRARTAPTDPLKTFPCPWSQDRADASGMTGRGLALFESGSNAVPFEYSDQINASECPEA